MYSMQGIVRRSIDNAINQFERLGQVGNNLANFNTRGYKTISFEQMLTEDGYLTGAISIPVFSESGEVAYTRDGAFKQGRDGYLVTNDDWIVGNGIKIPTNCYKFEIKPNGDVVAYTAADDPKPEHLGNIPLVRFENPEGLEQIGKNKLVPTEVAGKAILVKNHDCFRQNNLENSNTSIYNGVTDMLRLNASMLASTRMIKVVDDMYNKAINIRE